MERTLTIGKTDLARQTRRMLDRARRGETLIVESYGEEQVAVVDVQDYRILRALAAYHALPPHPAPVNDPAMEPAGLTEEEVEADVREADGSPQARWNRVIQAYLDEHINLGRAAKLLGLSVFELEDRFRRLDVPRRYGPETSEEALEDVETARAWTTR
jgi:predicted HTH domain antitoxin